jgi:hypothetical protein
VTQSLKERFRFSGDLLNIPHARSVTIFKEREEMTEQNQKDSALPTP